MRRMNIGFQKWNVGRMLAGTRVSTEMFDVSANMDRTLHYGENLRNIQSMTGTGRSRHGMDAMQERYAQEEHMRRQDTNRQTGVIQSPQNRILDRRFQAMRPGKRISASGHRYYERRINRSDRGKLL